MINQTCFTAPTGVPVAVITHWSVPPPAGTCRVLPAGQVAGAADEEAVAAIPVTATTQTAIIPTEAVTVAARTRRRFLGSEIRGREIFMAVLIQGQGSMPGYRRVTFQ